MHYAISDGARVAQVDLLANVGALLADTQSLLTRLQDGDAADADDGGFFAADPSTSPGRQASPSPNSSPSAAQPAQPADEVATDEVYEFQVGAHQSLSVPLFLAAQNGACNLVPQEHC